MGFGHTAPQADTHGHATCMGMAGEQCDGRRLLSSELMFIFTHLALLLTALAQACACWPRLWGPNGALISVPQDSARAWTMAGAKSGSVEAMDMEP